jgi:hypothetical protein
MELNFVAIVATFVFGNSYPHVSTEVPKVWSAYHQWFLSSLTWSEELGLQRN